MRIQCRKCFLEDMEQDKYIESLQNYIKSYPLEERASEEVYKSRLEMCKTCDELANGMCAKCGCFVQLRALKKSAQCASENKYW